MLSPWLKIAGDPTLPLGIPDSHPAPLYRGVVLDLTRPDAAIVRRSLLGNAFEDYHAPDEGAFSRCHNCPQPSYKNYPPGPGDGTQGAFPWGRDFSDQALAWNGGGYHWTQMGPLIHRLAGPGDDVEWTTDPQTAEKVALDGKRNALRLPVVFSRPSPGGEVSGMRILHPQNGKWRELSPRGPDRTAALAKTLVDNLEDEYADWWDQTGWGGKARINSWPHVEEFLKDRYPAAHRGLSYGFEEARPLLDWDWRHPDEDPGQLQRYQTGPEAIAQHGYDPKEVAAAMLLLHNESDPSRADLSDEDQQRLVDIAEKRTKMQRDFERRQP